jgi:Tripartite tricarboxylate transporter TctB family
MILHRLHGLLFFLLGGMSLVDGWRIAQQAREGANFDAIGPDRYLIALGALMLLAGLWRLLRGLPVEMATAAAVPDRDAGATSNLLVTLAMLVGFALLVPVLGFSPTCFLFLAAQLRLLGGWTWWRSVGVGALIALAFHVSFISFADMPLPKGYFGI